MRIARTAVLGLFLIAAGCGGSADDREEVRGIVLGVEGDLASVRSFLLRTDDGEVLRVVPAPDGDFGFPLPHLHEHRRTSEPLLVELDRSHDPPRAISLRDADNPEWHGEPRTGTRPPDEEDLEEEEPDEEDGGEQQDTAVPPTSPPETPSPQEDEQTTPSTSGPDPETGEESGAPAATTSTTSTSPTTSTTRVTVEESGEQSHVVEEDVPDSPEQAGREPEGSGDEADEPPIEVDVEPEGPVIELVVTDGKLDGGARRESVALGDTVTIRVSGNTDDEVHVHGYDLFLELEGGDGELTFEASIPGVFEIELEGSHTLLVRLEVS